MADLFNCTGQGVRNTTKVWITGEGTIKDHFGFNKEEDCKILHDAMKGFGTNEDKIIGIVAHRSNAQRQELLSEYSQKYGENLIDMLKSELGGNFEDAVVALFRKPDEFEAWCLHEAMSGLGTNENTLIEILCSRNNEELRRIIAAYKKLYNKDLAKEVESETGGNFKKLLHVIAQAKRPIGFDSPFGFWNVYKAKKDAQLLYEAGEKKWGTDESHFHTVFATRSFVYLDLVAEQYEKISKKTLVDAIKSELTGDLEGGMVAIVQCADNRIAYFADCLYDSMKGVGTDDTTLIRIIASRSEVDLVQIKAYFNKKYGKTLEQFIESDCSGDYKKLLLQICHGN